MELSRREFLKSILGTSLLASACSRQSKRHAFSGKFLGTDERSGHRLIGKFKHSLPRKRASTVVIVGGGISGLSAGWRLLRAGFDDFVILEMEPQLGGTSASGHNATTSFPWAAHYICAPGVENRSLIKLLDEMRVIDNISADGRVEWSETVLCHAPQERLFFQGSWYEGLFPAAGASAKDIEDFIAFGRTMNNWSERRDSTGRRAFSLPISTCSNSPEFTSLDKISMADYMAQNGWASERLRWWVDYACRDDYGLALEETSAWAGIFYFASRIDYPGAKPAEFLTWPDGNGRVVEHLRKALGERVITRAMVTEIIDDAPAPGVRALNFVEESDGSWELYSAKKVICATPAFITARILTSYRSSAKEKYLSHFEYTPWVIANISLRDRPKSRGYAPAWDNVLYGSKSLGYVDATFQTGRPAGPTVWTWYFPLCGKDPKAMRRQLLLSYWADWRDAILADLGLAHQGFEELIDNLDVWRWGHAMIRPEPGFVWGGAPQRAAIPANNIHFANTDLSGIPLFEEAHAHGVRAAEEVMRELGVSFSKI